VAQDQEIAWHKSRKSDSKPNLNEIKMQFSQLSRFPSESDVGFLKWWFGLSLSHEHLDWVMNVLNQGQKSLTYEIASQSLLNESWRRPDWLKTLSDYQGCETAVFEAWGKFDVLKSHQFIENLFAQASSGEMNAFFVGFFQIRATLFMITGPVAF
jgi:hypothetical protein